MALKNAVQSVQTAVPRVTHLDVIDRAKSVDVDPALIYVAAVMACSQWTPAELLQYCTQAKIELLTRNAALPPAPKRNRSAEPVAA